MKEAYIKAIEYYLPERVVTNGKLVEHFPERDAEKVTKKTGIRKCTSPLTTRRRPLPRGLYLEGQAAA